MMFKNIQGNASKDSLFKLHFGDIHALALYDLSYVGFKTTYTIGE